MLCWIDVRMVSIISDGAPNMRHENHVSIHDIKLMYLSYFCHPFIKLVVSFFCLAERENLKIMSFTPNRNWTSLIRTMKAKSTATINSQFFLPEIHSYYFRSYCPILDLLTHKLLSFMKAFEPYLQLSIAYHAIQLFACSLSML